MAEDTDDAAVRRLFRMLAITHADCPRSVCRLPLRAHSQFHSIWQDAQASADHEFDEDFAHCAAEGRSRER